MAGIVHEVENTDLLAQVRQESAARGNDFFFTAIGSS